MFRALTVSALLLSTFAWADVDSRFVKLRDDATAIGSLGNEFLDKYIGRCGSVLEGGADCARNAEIFRKSSNGKKFYFILTEDSVSQLSLAGMQPGSDEVSINLVPFFPGSDSAVTAGAPTKTDANGNPVMSFLTMNGKLLDGWSASMVARQISSRTLRLQVIFTPQGTWTLPKKGGGKISGVKARIDAVVVTVGRTGEQVAIYIAK